MAKLSLRSVRRKLSSIKQEKLAEKNYQLLKTRSSSNSKIRIGFIVQMPEVWDKEAPLLEALINDERFEVTLLVVPEYDLVAGKVKTEYDSLYFFEKYPEFAKKAFEDGKWVDISTFNFDYVFYQRPYNLYLPDELKSGAVSKVSRCCYIPYAFWPLGEDLCGYNSDFFRDVYFAFMDSEENRKELIRKEKIFSSEERLLFCGYPSLDNLKTNTKGRPTDVLWAPRWSYDKKRGGSHFFEMKDGILELAGKDSKLIIRPHPLAFQNYVRIGKMSEEDVELYKKEVTGRGASFDSNKLIEDTFDEVGVLISDISSIIFTFFLSEKPIIYCDAHIPISPSFRSLLDGMYIAESWEDVKETYLKICAGDDRLMGKRHEIAEKIRKEHTGATERIKRILVEDHERRKG